MAYSCMLCTYTGVQRVEDNAKCACRPGLTSCNGACVDLDANVDDCGMCGNLRGQLSERNALFATKPKNVADHNWVSWRSFNDQKKNDRQTLLSTWSITPYDSIKTAFGGTSLQDAPCVLSKRLSRRPSSCIHLQDRFSIGPCHCAGREKRGMSCTVCQHLLSSVCFSSRLSLGVVNDRSISMKRRRRKQNNPSLIAR